MTAVKGLRVFLTTLVLIGIFLGNGVSVFAGEQAPVKRVLFLPFNVQEAGEFSYLQDGSANMLACRVADRVKIGVVDWSPMVNKLTTYWVSGQKNVFMQHLQEVAADYLVTGELIFSAQGLHINVMVFDVATGFRVQNVEALAADESEIISIMDRLGWDVVEKVFGGKRPEKTEAVAPKSCTIFQSPHPEKEYKASQGRESVPEDSALPGVAPLAISGAPGSSGKNNVWPNAEISSGAFDVELKGLEIGDLDGDGVLEVVVVSDTVLYIHHHLDNGFHLLDSLALPENLKVYSLNLADLSGDGRPEIYICASRGDRPSSWVLEWDRVGRARYLVQDYRYYLRPVVEHGVFGRKTVLLGQRVGVDRPLAPAIYQLALTKDNAVMRRDKVNLPAGTNIFNFARADLIGDGTQEVITVDQQGQLRVFAHTGVLLWKSMERYGEGKTYFGPDLAKRDREDEADLVFVPARILVHDLDGDGQQEVIIRKNNMGLSRYLKNNRWFDDGRVVVLKWLASEMRQVWKGEVISGYLADYQYLSGNTDRRPGTGNPDGGKRYMYICQVLEGGFLSGLFSEEVQSRILVQQLGD